MQAIKHRVKHYYQPGNSSCGYTALSILLSFYDVYKKPVEVVEAVAPQGHDEGSLTSEVATWCTTLGLKVHFYSFDFQITDFAWKNLSKDKLISRLSAVEHVRNVPSLGKDISARYVRSYIQLLKSGAKLTIANHPSVAQLYTLLKTGPVYINVCPKVLHGTGRAKTFGLRKSKPDDVNGEVHTHSVVIHGNDSKGNFYLADPWDGLYSRPPETVLCAMVAAEIECDNQLFVLSK